MVIIGHHVLYGKIVDLEKPFLVVQKIRGSNETSFNIQAKITKKLVFKTRPKPIVTNVPKK